MSRLLPICPGRRSFGGTATHNYLGMCLCDCVCVEDYGKEVNTALVCCWEPTWNYGHGGPKGIKESSLTFGNK